MRAAWIVVLVSTACGTPSGTARDLASVDDTDGATADAATPTDDFPSALRHFYVSPSGDDTADGLSPAHAWKTLAHVNAAPLLAGDAVLFQRGGTWRESLTVGVSGTADQPIGFGAYGSGDRPRLYGSDILAGSMMTDAGAGAFTIPATTVSCVTVDHQFLVLSPGAPTAGTYDFSNGTLRIDSGSDPRTDGKLYSVCTRDDVVYTNAHDHLRFSNLAVDESAKADAGYGIRVMNSTDVELDDCEIDRAGKHHVGAINSTAFVARNLHAAYPMPGQGANASAYVSFGDGSGGPPSNQTHEWHGCTFEHPEDLASGGSPAYAFITHGAAIGSVLVDGMVSHGANLSVSNGDNPSARVRVTGGLVDDARLEVDGSGIVVDGLELSGALASIDLIGSSLVVQNVLLRGGDPQSAWYQTAIASRGTNNTVRFSTIVMAQGAAGYDTCFALVNAGTAFHSYANLCVATKRVWKLWAGAPDAADVAQSDYDLYPAAPTFDDGDLGLSTWQAAGLDTTAKLGDPQLESDGSPGAGSIAIDAAPLPTSLLTEVPVDFRGHPRLQGAAFDIGAFERTP